MLYISLGKKQEHEILFPDDWVKFNKTTVNSWLKDDFVKQMILDVDKTEVREDCSIYSPYLGIIPVESLSTGVKNLMIGYGTNLVLNASKCGDNCAKWIYEISKKKDLYITLYHIIRFPDDLQAIIINDDLKVNNYQEYHNRICEWWDTGE
jgi:hypothetical protein